MVSGEEPPPLIQPQGGIHQPILGLVGTFKQLGDPHQPPALPFDSIHSQVLIIKSQGSRMVEQSSPFFSTTTKLKSNQNLL